MDDKSLSSVSRLVGVNGMVFFSSLSPTCQPTDDFAIKEAFAIQVRSLFEHVDQELAQAGFVSGEKANIVFADIMIKAAGQYEFDELYPIFDELYAKWLEKVQVSNMPARKVLPYPALAGGYKVEMALVIGL
jgi:enamine deaminase RidA (YjgF/YER057c/UK114 family)